MTSASKAYSGWAATSASNVVPKKTCAWPRPYSNIPRRRSSSPTRPAISFRPTRRSAASAVTPSVKCSTNCRACSLSTNSRKATCAMWSSNCTSAAAGKVRCGSSAVTATITRPGSASPRYWTTKATWPATCASSPTSANARPANSASTAWPTTTPLPTCPTAHCSRTVCTTPCSRPSGRRPGWC
ncbi:hypothetical protein D3C80_1317220 [compost metagenome]